MLSIFNYNSKITKKLKTAEEYSVYATQTRDPIRVMAAGKFITKFYFGLTAKLLNE